MLRKLSVEMSGAGPALVEGPAAAGVPERTTSEEYRLSSAEQATQRLGQQVSGQVL